MHSVSSLRKRRQSKGTRNAFSYWSQTSVICTAGAVVGRDAKLQKCGHCISIPTSVLPRTEVCTFCRRKDCAFKAMHTRNAYPSSLKYIYFVSIVLVKGFDKSCSIPCPVPLGNTAELDGLSKHWSCNLQCEHNRLSWIRIISILLAARQRKWLSLCPLCKSNRRQKCPNQITSAHFLKAISSVSLTVSCDYFSCCCCYCFAV